MFYLGGFRIVGAGWLGYQSVFVDFVSQYGEADGYLWQLYANRTLIGRTSSRRARRCIGQMLDADVPTPLTLIRVDAADAATDFGPELPRVPWNRFELNWSADSFPADSDHFDITGSVAPGGPVVSTNVIARVPFNGNGDYSFVLPPITQNGTWTYAVTSRDDAFPLGNASAVSSIAITAGTPPPDVTIANGRRFTLTKTGDTVQANFAY